MEKSEGKGKTLCILVPRFTFGSKKIHVQIPVLAVPSILSFGFCTCKMEINSFRILVKFRENLFQLLGM